MRPTPGPAPRERAVVLEPPNVPLSEAALDAIYELPFQKAPHPSYRGEIPAFTMIKDSVTVVRGCAGGSSFCGLGLHQGKFLSSRSEASVPKELRRMGKTILISSHILSELADCCTSIGIIERGQLLMQGPIADVYRRIRGNRIVQIRFRNQMDRGLSLIRSSPHCRDVQVDDHEATVVLETGFVPLDGGGGGKARERQEISLY